VHKKIKFKMETGVVNVIELAMEASAKATQDSKSCSGCYCGAEKGVSSCSCAYAQELIFDSLRNRGYVILNLSSEQTTLIQELSEQATTTLWSCTDQAKKQAMKEYRKSKTLRNWFSYATLNGPGKESWKVHLRH
jgi:hypothetical protein